MNRFIEVTASAALLIVATTLVFVPESRTAPMRLANLVLFFILGGQAIWQYWRSGILNKTPAEIYAMPTRPKGSLISAVAFLMAAVAVTISGY